MVYGDFKTFQRRTASNKVFQNKAYHIAYNPYDRCERGLPSMIEIFFNNKSASAANTTAKTATVCW